MKWKIVSCAMLLAGASACEGEITETSGVTPDQSRPAAAEVSEGGASLEVFSSIPCGTDCVQGYLDGITRDGRGVATGFWGWAASAEEPEADVRVSIRTWRWQLGSAGPECAAGSSNNVQRDDVNAHLGISGVHGFYLQRAAEASAECADPSAIFVALAAVGQDATYAGHFLDASQSGQREPGPRD